MGDWCSEHEQARWQRAALNNNLRFPSAIVYAIAVLEEGDFENMGREMPSGTGIDNSLEDDEENTGTSKTNKKRSNSRSKSQNRSDADSQELNELARVMEESKNVDTQIRTLELLIQYGNPAKKNFALIQIERLSNLLPSQTYEEFLRENPTFLADINND